LYPENWNIKELAGTIIPSPMISGTGLQTQLAPITRQRPAFFFFHGLNTETNTVIIKSRH
jgi:hypothetical protein